MSATDLIYRDALAEFHRRTLRLQFPGSLAGWLLLLQWRGRDAWARRDYLMLAGIGLSIGSVALNGVVDFRRAPRRVDEDLAREQINREHAPRTSAGTRGTARGVYVPVAALIPPGQSAVGCLAPTGLLVAGWVQAGWDYLHRPDRGRRPTGPRWTWRPGPAWWTAWSWQQLPVNAASTAARSDQIAYERRQLVTLSATGLASRLVTAWGNELRPALADREWSRLTARLLKIAASGVASAAEYRRVPHKVDAQRARRRRHEAAVAALERDLERSGPRNPWRFEMAVTGLITTVWVAAFLAQLVHLRHRPKPPPPPRPRPGTRKRAPLAA